MFDSLFKYFIQRDIIGVVRKILCLLRLAIWDCGHFIAYYV